MTLLLGNVEADDDLAKVAIPTGFIKAFPSFAVPALDQALGWTLCDSKEVNLPVSQGGAGGIYDALWGVIGSTYNTSGGIAAPAAGKFRVPGLMYNGSVAGTMGRIPAGSGSTMTRGHARGAQPHRHSNGGYTFAGGHRHDNGGAPGSGGLNAYHRHGTSGISNPGHYHSFSLYSAYFLNEDEGAGANHNMCGQYTGTTGPGFSPSWNERENYGVDGLADWTTPTFQATNTDWADAAYVAVVFAVKL